MQKRARRTPTPTILCCLAVLLAMAPATAQVCGPLDNGRIADAFYEGTLIIWDPIVEYDKIILTITGPCEDIVHEFGPKDQPMFDIREIERIVDGQYSWTLQRVAPIDGGVQEALHEARGSGKEDALWWDLFQAGKLPEGPFTDAGSFTVERGQIVDPASGEEKALAVEGLPEKGLAGGVSLGGESQLAGLEKATVLTTNDGVVYNSLCVGFDCPTSPTFSDSTIMLTENNTRIKFDDTSTSSSFPRNDWEIKANSTNNGGRNWLGFTDCGQGSGGGCADDHVFGVEAGAPAHALWVDPSGDVGLGVLNPVVRMHMTDSDTPALRLEQNTSAGFGAQVWDIAGNETNFFVRDATNGSTLPFRIFPGSSSSTLVVRNSRVGVGTSNPSELLHLSRTDDAKILVENTTGTSATRILQHLRNEGTTVLRFENTAAPALGDVWDYQVANGGAFQISAEGSGGVEFLLTPSGNLTITGNLITGGGGLCDPGPCDGTFSPEYEVESIEEHAEYMWKNRHLWGVGPTPEGAPINLSKKTTGILHELEKAHIYIEQLHSTVTEVEKRNAELESRLAALEEMLIAMGDE